MSTRERSCCCATSDGALPQEDAVMILHFDVTKLLSASELIVRELGGKLDASLGINDQHDAALAGAADDDVDKVSTRPDYIRVFRCDAYADVVSSDSLPGSNDQAVTGSGVGDDSDTAALISKLVQTIEIAQRGLSGGFFGPFDSDGADAEGGTHDASPSAGESAEPGLASTVSVEGEPAAGGPNPGSPATDLRTALLQQADQLYSALAELRRTPEVIARIHAHRDALCLLTALPTSNSTGHAFFYADAAIDAAEDAIAALAEALPQP